MAGEITPGNFEIGASYVSFGGVQLGGTEGAPKISIVPEFYESKCEQTGGLVLKKRLIGVKISVTATFKEISNIIGTGKLLPALKKSDIGKDIYEGGEALILTPVDGDTTRVFKFPNAVVVPQMEYDLKGVEEHGIAVTFECLPDTTSGAFMEIGTTV